ncbi:MAG: sugar phosphate isomerase/epimerase [Pseudomonadota bacterium]
MPIVGVGLTTGDFANNLRDLNGCLDKFERLGATHAELSFGAFDLVAGGKPIPKRIAELKRICADRPLAYTVHGPIASNFMDRRNLQLQVDICRAVLDVSGEIGAEVQVHHGGASIHGDAAERAAQLELERETLALIAPHAECCGVVLCVENIFSDDAIWLASPAELAAQIRAVNHPSIRACIDFSHAAINAGVRGFDLMAELAELAPVARHLHIHDSFGRPRSFTPYTYGEAVNFGLGDLHLPPGWGVLDWEAIAKLPYREKVVANLELSTRFEEELPDAIALCRRMIALSA